MHNNMPMRCSIALDNMTRTIPPIDEDQKVALLHAPFKCTTLFGGELSVPSTSLRSEHSPSGIYSFGAHCGKLHVPPSSKDIGNAILLKSLDMVGFKLSWTKPGSGDFALESKAQKIVARACKLSSQPVQPYQQVSQFMGSLNWDSGSGSHSTGSSAPEATTVTMTFLCSRSVKPVYTTSSIRPIGPANLLQHWQVLSFLTSGIPIRLFQADFTIYTDASTQGWVPI